jgi:hypothetical protein
MWEKNIKFDPTEKNGRKCVRFQTTQNRVQRQFLKNFRVPEIEEFLGQLSNYHLFKENSVLWS